MRAGKLTVRDERIVAVLSPSVEPAATEGGDGGRRLAVAELSQFVTYPHHITIVRLRHAPSLPFPPLSS
jgi:hypothetical protein